MSQSAEERIRHLEEQLRILRRGEAKGELVDVEASTSDSMPLHLLKSKRKRAAVHAPEDLVGRGLSYPVPRHGGGHEWYHGMVGGWSAAEGMHKIVWDHSGESDWHEVLTLQGNKCRFDEDNLFATETDASTAEGGASGGGGQSSLAVRVAGAEKVKKVKVERDQARSERDQARSEEEMASMMVGPLEQMRREMKRVLLELHGELIELGHPKRSKNNTTPGLVPYYYESGSWTVMQDVIWNLAEKRAATPAEALLWAVEDAAKTAAKGKKGATRGASSSLSSSSAAADSSSAAATLEGENAEINKEWGLKVAAAEGRVVQLEKKLARADETIKAAAKESRVVREKRGVDTGKLAAAEGRVARLEGELEEAEEKLGAARAEVKGGSKILQEKVEELAKWKSLAAKIKKKWDIDKAKMATAQERVSQLEEDLEGGRLQPEVSKLRQALIKCNKLLKKAREEVRTRDAKVVALYDTIDEERQKARKGAAELAKAKQEGQKFKKGAAKALEKGKQDMARIREAMQSGGGGQQCEGEDCTQYFLFGEDDTYITCCDCDQKYCHGCQSTRSQLPGDYPGNVYAGWQCCATDSGCTMCPGCYTSIDRDEDERDERAVSGYGQPGYSCELEECESKYCESCSDEFKRCNVCSLDVCKECSVPNLMGIVSHACGMAKND
jgi:hypothetical protein